MIEKPSVRVCNNLIRCVRVPVSYFIVKEARNIVSRRNRWQVLQTINSFAKYLSTPWNDFLRICSLEIPWSLFNMIGSGRIEEIYEPIKICSLDKFFFQILKLHQHRTQQNRIKRVGTISIRELLRNLQH